MALNDKAWIVTSQDAKGNFYKVLAPSILVSPDRAISGLPVFDVEEEAKLFLKTQEKLGIQGLVVLPCLLEVVYPE
jgi:hypothetical protein